MRKAATILLMAISLSAYGQHVHTFDTVSTSDTTVTTSRVRTEDSTALRTVAKWRETKVCSRCGKHQSKPFAIVEKVIYLWRR